MTGRRNRVEISRDKLDRLLERNAELKKLAIRFGSMGADGGPAPPHPNGDGLNVAEVLQLHEFGLGVPERPVVRAVVNGKRDELAKALAAGAVAALDVGARAAAVAPILGKRAAELLLEAHDDLGLIVDSEGFMRQALDDTGAIRDSLQWTEDE